MTHFWTRVATIGVAASALAACATAQYPTVEGQAQREPAPMPTPNFPITQPAETPAAPVAAPSGPAVTSQTLAPPPAAVTSQPLAPLVQAPPPAPVTKTITVAAGKVVDAQGKAESYEVKSGEGLDAIARKLGTTRARLAEDNDLKAPYNLRPGQVLQGPTAKAKAYVVQSGDTLFAIARRFSTSAPSLAAANGFEVSTPIRPGQKLLLPPGFKDIGPSTRTVTITPPAPVYQPPVQVVQTPPPATLVAQTPAVLPPVVQVPVQTPTPRPYTPPYTPPVAKPYTPPPAATTTPPPVMKPYTPPPAAVVARPYTPPATVARPYTPPATSGNALIQTNAPPTDNEVATAGRGRFVWPLMGEVISGFGPKGGGQRNDGLNIRGVSGTDIRAAASGEVVYAGDQVPGFGNLILVKHADGWVTAYAHLSRIDVKMRDQVSQGQQIGKLGATGGVGEPQLHFEVRYAPSPKDKARPVDPQLVLPRS